VPHRSRITVACVCLSLALTTASQAAEQRVGPNLRAGDIAIIQYRTDTGGAGGAEGFSFVATTALPGGTTIRFTDKAWTGFGLSDGEHVWSWTAPPAGLPAGAVVQCQGSHCSPGSLAAGQVIQGLSKSGEQLLAFQGDPLAPRFLDALSTVPWDVGEIDSSAQSRVPLGLAGAERRIRDGLKYATARDFKGLQQNGAFRERDFSGDAVALRHALSRPENWLRDNSKDLAFRPPTFWSFDLEPADRLRIEAKPGARGAIEPYVGHTLGAGIENDAVLELPLRISGGAAGDAALESRVEILDATPGFAPVARLDGVGDSTDESAADRSPVFIVETTRPGQASLRVHVSDGRQSDFHAVLLRVTAVPEDAGFLAHRGISDASTAVAFDDEWMLVGNDERTVGGIDLWLYSRRRAGFGSPLVADGDAGAAHPKPEELDLEASLRAGNRVYWLASQSNNKRGRCRPARRVVLETEIVKDAAGAPALRILRSNRDLRQRLIDWDAGGQHGRGAGHYAFSQSACCAGDSSAVRTECVGAVPPKLPMGFNLEGFARAPRAREGWALLGFRAPIVRHSGSADGEESKLGKVKLPDSVADAPADWRSVQGRTRALVLPVRLSALFDGETESLFGEPIELDLGGRSVRSIARNDSDEYLILAGPTAGSKREARPPYDFALYLWSGRDPDVTGDAADVPRQLAVDLEALRRGAGSFEAIVEVPDPVAGSSVQLLIDDGSTRWSDWSPPGAFEHCEPCLAESKRLPREFQMFRSVWVGIEAPAVRSAPDTHPRAR